MPKLSKVPILAWMSCLLIRTEIPIQTGTKTMAVSSSRKLAQGGEPDRIPPQRCMHILGLKSGNHWASVRELIGGQKERGGNRFQLYSSVLSFCDALRKTYCIPDRRPRLTDSRLRYSDAALLPFPLSDTIDENEATRLLECSMDSLYGFIENRRFYAYRLLPRTPWRISRSSLAVYMGRRAPEGLGPAGDHRPE